MLIYTLELYMPLYVHDALLFLTIYKYLKNKLTKSISKHHATKINPFSATIKILLHTQQIVSNNINSS
jgi:hypothetical protein